MQPSDLRGRRVAVWGAAREGRAAVELLAHHGPADLVLVDDSPSAVGPEGVPVLSGAAGAAALAAAEVVVKSPGISPHRPDVAVDGVRANVAAPRRGLVERAGDGGAAVRGLDRVVLPHDDAALTDEVAQRLAEVGVE